MRIKKAVIPVAGFGTRFYPLTRAQPKEMLPILDKPVIHYVVEEALKAGLDEILMIVGKEKESIINYFDKHKLDAKFEGFKEVPDIFFVRQKEALGLGDAVRYSKKFVGDEPFVLLLGDTIYVSKSDSVSNQLVNTYKRKNASIIAVEKVSRDKIKDYGMIDGKKVEERLWRITSTVEKPMPEEAPSEMGMTGAYVFDPSIYDYLEMIKPGKNGEYQLTDAIQLMCKEKEVYGYEIEGKRYDIGTKELWIKAFIEFVRNSKEYSKLLQEKT